MAAAHGDDFMQVTGPAYLQTLITGRGPTRSGPGGEPRLSEVLAQWAEDKGIQLTGGITYKTFGFLAARKIHQQGTELYNEPQPAGLFDQVLSPEFLNTLKARIAAGEMVAITTALNQVLR
jgi:hypothetical protein